MKVERGVGGERRLEGDRGWASRKAELSECQVQQGATATSRKRRAISVPWVYLFHDWAALVAGKFSLILG